jgi:uncharacterized protein YbjT (DUF2867 family)
MGRIVVFGATGYTGRLTAERLVAHGAAPVLAGRSEARLRELSDRLGGVALALGVEDEVVRYVLFDRGRVMDEYLSVPTYFGELPPGDVVALAANPTVVARLTGADPARVRAVARTASSPSELPPAEELAEQIRDAMGLPPG